MSSSAAALTTEDHADLYNNNIINIMMHGHHFYGTHPMSNGQNRRTGAAHHHGGQAHGHGGQHRGGGGGGQEIILHPALFGHHSPASGPRRPVPNLLPRGPPHYNPPLLGPRPSMGPPPPPSSSGPDPFVEEQIEMLAEKIEGLEGELRYAWRALDVLSQEYVKMWQRLEKMEGLLSEQQTVITQLIDLYSADSSDGGLGSNGLKSGATSPTSIKSSQVPDENFYKALNAVHGEANTEMQLALSASQSIDDLMNSEDEDDEDEGSGKVVLPPANRSSSGYSKQGTFADFLKGFDKNGKPKQSTTRSRRRGSQGSDSDVDAKSVTSSIRSSLSANTVKSEDVGDFPLPGELSPGYENATPPTPPTISQYPKKKKKQQTRSSPPTQLPPQQQQQSKMKKSRAGKLSSSANTAEDKNSSSSPLKVIGGKYSFSVTDKGASDRRGGGPPPPPSETAGVPSSLPVEPLGSPQVANGKSLYPSLQTAMRPQNQQQQQQQQQSGSKRSKKKSAAMTAYSEDVDPHYQEQQQQPLTPTSSTPGGGDKSRKLSLKEKRKLRAERNTGETPRDLDLTAASEAVTSGMSSTLVQPQQTTSNNNNAKGSGNKGHFVAPGLSPQQLQSGVYSPTTTSGGGGGPPGHIGTKSASESDQSVSPIKMDSAAEAVAGGGSNGSSSTSNSNGVLMRTTSREFAVSRALGKYREKQKKVHGTHQLQQNQQQQGVGQHRPTSIGSNSDSQEDLDKTPKSSPPRISMIEEDEFDDQEEDLVEAEIGGGEQSVDSPNGRAEAELADLGAKLAQFGDSMRPFETFTETSTDEAEANQQLQQQQQSSSVIVPESSSSEEVLESDRGQEGHQQHDEQQQQQKPALQRRSSEDIKMEMAAIKAEKAAAEAAKQAEKAAKEATKQAAGVAKSAFGLFGASKFGKLAMGAAASAAQAAKDVQQQQQQQQQHGQLRSGATSRASSAGMGPGSSRRQSTEESIDTDDEWYRHEIRELEQIEYEKKLESVRPSASINEKMNHVFIELSATVPKTELEACQAFDREQKSKQATFGPPPRPTAESAGALLLAGGLPAAATTEAIYTSTSEDEDHKKVIMRFQSSAEDYDAEDSRDESSHAKRKGRKGHSESSENDSEATQSGPDSLMEDTGNSSDNLVLDSSDPNQPPHRTRRKSSQPKASKIGINIKQANQQLGGPPPASKSSSSVEATASGGGLHGSQGSLSSSQKSHRKGSNGSGNNSAGSSNGSRKSQRSVKQQQQNSSSGNGNGNNVVAENQNTTNVTKVEGMPGPDEYDDEEYDEDEYGTGGYYDENGEWVEASGYYDENGDWVETGGYYDESGEWVEYAGYYDENGDWIDVEVPEEIPDQSQYYQDSGGGTDAPGDPGGGGGELPKIPEEPAIAAPAPADQSQQQQNKTGYFLANRGVAVFPQTQTPPRQKFELQTMESIEGTLTHTSESYNDTHHQELTAEDTEDTTEIGGEAEPETDDDDDELEDERMDSLGPDFDPDPGGSDDLESRSRSERSRSQRSRSDHTLIDQDESSPHDEDQEISMGSGKMQIKDHTNNQNHTSENTNKDQEDFINEDDIIDENNENNINNTTNSGDEDMPSLASIMAKRKGQGWNALKKTLADRREEIMQMVRLISKCCIICKKKLFD